MRFGTMLFGAAALMLSHVAVAQAEPIRIDPVSYSPEFQTALSEDFGEREGVYLRNAVTRAVSAELTRHGASIDANAAVAIETTIVDADPNRPTFKQLTDRPGLDPMRSISLGGAELRAVLRGADGQVLDEVTHRRYDFTISDLIGATTTWSSAHQAIRQFARKVADAYVAQSS